MSGKKASDVNALLRNSSQTRSSSIGVLENSWRELEKATADFNEYVIKLDSTVKSAETKYSDVVKKEFPDEVKRLQEKYERLIREIDLERKTNSDTEYKKIMSEYQEQDKIADKVRLDIKNKIRNQGRSDPWYCDEEFKSAHNVQNEYNKLAKRVNVLNTEYLKTTKNTKMKLTKMKEKNTQLKNIMQDIKDIEKKATEIQKIREEASLAKKTVENDFGKIEKELAIKFMEEDYKKIEKESKAFLKLDDKDVVLQCQKTISQINLFNDKLKKVYEEFKEKQNMAKAEIDAILYSLNNKVYSHPEDDFKKAGDYEKLSAIEFLDSYCKQRFQEEITSYVNQSKKMYENEKFEEVHDLSEKFAAVMEQIGAECARVHENKKKTITNMLTIKKVMLDLNYDVEVTKNENMEDGYCIECTAGDECITYEKVTVVDEGKPIIDIDHKEATVGTCGNPWSEIRQCLSEEGLFIEDIKKNGKSIHNSVQVSNQVEKGQERANLN